jgi:hypothetical protein
VTYFSMKERAAQFGMTAEMLAKNDIVLEGALRSLEICKAAWRKGRLRHRPAGRAAGRPEPGVHPSRQGAEADRDHPAGDARRRRDRAAGGQARRHRAGAFADLIAVDGNPLKKLELFLDQGSTCR